MKKLSIEEANKALAKINSMGAIRCPLCGSTNNVSFDPNGTELHAIGAIEDLLTKHYMDAIPVITGVCKHCGYVMQFSLRHLGCDC